MESYTAQCLSNGRVSEQTLQIYGGILGQETEIIAYSATARRLRELFPNSQLTLVIDRRHREVGELLTGLTYVDRLFAPSLCEEPLPRTLADAWRLGWPANPYGEEELAEQRFHDLVLPTRPRPRQSSWWEQRHEVEEIAYSAGVPGPIDLRTEIRIPSATCIPTIAQGKIVVHFGPDENPSEGWPWERVRQLVTHFPAESILLLGHPGPEVRGVLDCRGKTSLAEAAAIIRGCRCFLGVDSVYMWIAGSLQARSVGLYGTSRVPRPEAIQPVNCQAEYLQIQGPVSGLSFELVLAMLQRTVDIEPTLGSLSQTSPSACSDANEQSIRASARTASSSLSQSSPAPTSSSATLHDDISLDTRRSVAWMLGKRPARWGLAVGAWGDTLAACGNIRAVLGETNQREIGALYIGNYEHVAPFLQAQEWCREAMHLVPRDESTLHEIVQLSSARAIYREEWLGPLLAGTGIDPEEVALTHTSTPVLSGADIQVWHSAALPDAPKLWADQLFWDVPELRALTANGEQPILIQPLSLGSNRVEHHWAHWMPALDWLLSQTSSTYILVGHGWTPSADLQSPRLINLVGKTPSMLEIFALAERCKLVLSTSNGLSLWTVIQKLGGVITLNAGIEGYFYHWINQSQNRLVSFRAPLSFFQHCFQEAMGETDRITAGQYCPLCGSPGIPVAEKDGCVVRECRCVGRVLLMWPWGNERQYDHFRTGSSRSITAAYGADSAEVRFRSLSSELQGTRRILEVNTGVGELLDRLVSSGYEAIGYDPSPQCVEVARACGRDVRLGNWYEIPRSSFAADLIVLGHLLECEPMPLAFLRHLRQLMDRETVLVVDAVEWGCQKGILEWTYFQYMNPQRYIALYDEVSARELFKRANLRLVALRYEPGGQRAMIRYILKRVG